MHLFVNKTFSKCSTDLLISTIYSSQEVTFLPAIFLNKHTNNELSCDKVLCFTLSGICTCSNVNMMKINVD